jgi:uncharacterized LabA/DUF88 family protein
MKKTVFFIDGFNLYHSIANPNYQKYKWLDLAALANHFTNKREKIIDIYFFTALAHWNEDKVKRHKIYIEALKSTGIKIIEGVFRKVDKKCRHCHQWYKTYEEKQTDVNIAVNLFKLAIYDRFDKAFIISGDSDLIPAIKAIKENFSQKEIVVVIPIHQKAYHLKTVCDSYIRIKEHHLEQYQFPDVITLKSGKILSRPILWK